MPVILIAIIFLTFFFGHFIPLEIKQLLYGLSLSIKSFILCLLPLVIIGLLYRAVTQMANNATKMMGLLLVCICCSNFISTFLSHYIGEWIYHLDLALISPETTLALTPKWVINWPQFLSNDKAIFLGIFSGIMLSKFKKNLAQQLAVLFELMINKILSLFCYLIPVFIIGFIVKMQYENVLHLILKDYLGIFAIVALAQFIYILSAYFFLTIKTKKKFINTLRHMLPAFISGFATMSSAASMPLTIQGTEKNTVNKDLAKSVIPTTVNIHLVGDCIAIPIFAYAVLKTFGIAEPSLFAYVIFTFYFVLAKFSVAAIPGGGILVMLPILETYLGFNNTMLSFITALYILFDPVITSANILGNGAFALFIDKIMTKKLYMTQQPPRALIKPTADTIR